ncbi:MAG: nucleotidyltransferase domain-containing protein [Anaerolineae bacterium]|nr:nucleotidyltransferase domain-containing protein [Anaerolineae bacterium]
MKQETRTAKRSTKQKRQPRRTARETAARYRTKPTSRVSAQRARWKIPHVTPIGSDAPVSKTLPLAVKRIAETLHPEKIILFGSYAYGNPTPDSDVDLLVVMPSQEPEIERYLLVSRLLRPRPFAVDILVKTPQEIAHSIENGDFFIDEIVSEGKVLYEQPKESA